MRKMSFHLPTKSECDAICEKSSAFYRIDSLVEGFNVAIYNYSHICRGVKNFITHNALELRGLCYVENSATSSWERHILLTKFFNINEGTGWMYDDVKDKEICNVTSKEDGSIISFVKLPNGKVRSKSKLSFSSLQAQMAQELYNENQNIRNFVNKCISMKEVPIFELVSPENQIVLPYPETELVLLQIRAENGKYLFQKVSAYANEFSLSSREEFKNGCYKSLDYLLDQQETNQEDIEGWVVTFGDGQMAKIKTKKYVSLHSSISPNKFLDHLLIAKILDGEIDDILSFCVGRNREKLESLIEKVEKVFNDLVHEFSRLHDEFCKKYNRDRKQFVKHASHHELFQCFMSHLHKEEDSSGIENLAQKVVKGFIKKKCNKLGKAKAFIEGKKYVNQ